MVPVGTPYLDAIDDDRASQDDEHAAARRRREPPHARPGYKRKRAIDRELAAKYEHCKQKHRGERALPELKQLCARRAWSIVQTGGRFPDYFGARKRARERTASRLKGDSDAMAKRKPQHYKSGPKKGQFMPRGHGGAKEAPRRSSRKKSSSRHKASSPRRSSPRSSSRRSAPRRSGGGGKANITVIRVPAAAETHRKRGGGGRRRRMREAPRATGGALIVFGVGGVLGAEGADMLHRVAQTRPADSKDPLPAGIPDVDTYNKLAVAAKPGVWSIVGQAALSVAGFVGGAVAAHYGMPLVSMFSYGVGFGAGFNLVTAVIDGYIVEPLFENTATGKRLYGLNKSANDAINPPTTGQTQGPPGQAALTGAIGAPPAERPALTQGPASRQIPIAKIPDTFAQRPAAVRAGGGGVGQPGGSSAQSGFTYGGSGNDLPPPGRGGPCCNSCAQGNPCEDGCAGDGNPQPPPPNPPPPKPDPGGVTSTLGAPPGAPDAAPLAAAGGMRASMRVLLGGRN